MNPEYGEANCIPGVTRVVNTVTCHTGVVHQILPKFGVQVWNKKDQTRENWYWSIVTFRIPRKIKRYPRPFRFPRHERTKVCHCPSGREVVEGEHEVRCLKCGFLIGEESFPKRYRRAEAKLRKKYFVKPPKASSRSKVQEGVDRPNRQKGSRSHTHSVKARKNNPSRVRGVQRGGYAKKKKVTRRAAALPKARQVSRRTKVSKVGQPTKA